MLKNSGQTVRLAALAITLISVVALIGIFPTLQPAAQTVLPTQMAQPTEQPTDPPAAAAQVDEPQPSPIPPTPLPTDVPVIEPVAAVATAVQPTQAFVPAASAESMQPSRPIPNQLTIRFEPGTSPAEQTAYIQRLGGTITERIEPLNTVVVTVPDAVSAQSLPASPIVAIAEPDYTVSAQQTTPNDPYYPQQWALSAMNVPAGWAAMPTTTSAVPVAVIDSGICSAHPDLAGRLLPGYDFVQKDSDPEDEYGHGCQVAGVIGAVANNGRGVAGVAPNTLIIPVRVLDAAGNGSYSNVAAGMVWAADHGAKIINLSLGGTDASNTLLNAVNYAVSRGVKVIAAAGNTNGGAVIYPAAYDAVIAVGSVDSNRQRSSFSAIGPQIDVHAPGSSILTTTLNNGYVYTSGTSFAAPNVAGVLALNMALGTQLALTGSGVVSVTLPLIPAPTPTPVTEMGRNGQITALDQASPTDTWVVVLQAGANPNTVAASLGFTNLGQVGTLPNVYLFQSAGSSQSAAAAQDTASALAASAQIIQFEQQFIHQHQPRIPGDDPLFGNQWHLNPSPGSVNANVLPAWEQGFTGDGVQIAIVDDGLQRTHPDLLPNYLPAGSWDFNGDCAMNFANPWNCPDADPSPHINSGDCAIDADCHGTSAAGVAGAADNIDSAPDNCGVGAAYEADLSGIRLIAKGTTDAQDAAAINYQNQLNDIYSNSWGPGPEGYIIGAPGLTFNIALENGITQGRGGRGNIFVWAAGNGRRDPKGQSGYQPFDNINADGYANSRYAIAVGAVGPDGVFAPYSEPGAAMLITAPSSNAGGTAPFLGMTTTDLLGGAGYSGGGCTNTYGGTSASAPLVAGIIALMLEANPNLTWRDVQYILLETAVKNDPANSDWRVNGAGYDINHNYGFGMVDAAAAVEMAKTWNNVGPELVFGQVTQPVNMQIQPNVAFDVTREMTISSGANFPVEHVEVVVNIDHQYRGDLEITLESPSGTISRLMEVRPADFNDNFSDWRLMTTLNWGENPNGVWKLRVKDSIPPGPTNVPDGGIWRDWKLTVYAQGMPRTPYLNLPADNAFIESLLGETPVTLSWTSDPAFANEEYDVRIGTQADLSAAPIIPVTTDSYTALLPYGTHFWQVRARNTVGVSAWSPVRKFTIGTSPNAAPLLNLFTTDMPTLTWNRVSWATGYEVQVSATNSFTSQDILYSVPADIDTLSVQVEAPLDEGSYFWRVCALSANSATPICSPPQSFIIDVP